MSEKERNAVENVVRGRQPVLVPLPVSLFFVLLVLHLTLDIGQDIGTACSSSSSCEPVFPLLRDICTINPDPGYRDSMF